MFRVLRAGTLQLRASRPWEEAKGCEAPVDWQAYLSKTVPRIASYAGSAGTTAGSSPRAGPERAPVRHFFGVDGARNLRHAGGLAWTERSCLVCGRFVEDRRARFGGHLAEHALSEQGCVCSGGGSCTGVAFTKKVLL